MERARLASWLLVGSLLTAAGCQTPCRDWSLFNRFRTTSLTEDCECLDGQGPYLFGEGAGMVPPAEGPFLPPPPTPVPPLPGQVPPATQEPGPPRIVPVPQATPMPYNPTKAASRKTPGPFLLGR